MISAKVIKTYPPFKPGIFRQEIHAAALAEAAAINRDFNATTRTWKHQVDFKTVTQDKPESVSIDVTTKDKIYGYVDEGTRPHIIRPKRRRNLSFKSKYKAKTTPHVIGSHQGGASGKQVFAKVVHHPGTEPRYFARDIQARHQPILAKRVEEAITRAAKKSGHSINK